MCQSVYDMRGVYARACLSVCLSLCVCARGRMCVTNAHQMQGADLTFFSRRAYVLVAWIWSICWYLPLDPIKWAANWVLNEEGVRDRGLFTRQQEAGRVEAAILNQAEHEGVLVGSIARGSWANPLGRTSLRVPTALELERASLVRVSVRAVPP
jgi:hypothetical protein